MWRSVVILIVAAVLFNITNRLYGETVYFLVAETEPFHSDSYVLPLTEPDDIAHARDLIANGPAAGAPIVVAYIDCSPDLINRDYLSSSKHIWSWHITQFDGFADITAEILDGWPGFVESNCYGWVGETGGMIGFWSYTVVYELGTNPAHWKRDLDYDYDVDFKDYVYLANNWGSNCGWCNGADFDNNGTIDFSDLKIFVEAWLSPFASPPSGW
jgi:hypothetical protein